jgi:hypothetical protein
VNLIAGGGDFMVIADKTGLDVETPLGTITASVSQFSLELQTSPAVPFSTTQSSSAESSRTPRLTVIVASGSVTIRHGGAITTLSAGDERVFF